MNNKIKLLTVVLSSVLIFSSCAQTPRNIKNNSTENKDSSSSDKLYYDGSMTYSNDLLIKQPEVNEYYSFSLVGKKISQSESLKKFNSLFDIYCKDKYDSGVVDDKKRFINDEIVNGSDEIAYPDGFPKICDYLDDIENNKIKAREFFVDDLKSYLSVHNGELMTLNNGNSFAYLKHNGVLDQKGVGERKYIGMFFPEIYCDVTKEYFQKSNDRYKLADEEVTISQACDTAKKCVEKIYDNDLIKPYVSQVRAVDMNGQYGIALLMTGEYKGVPFDANEMKTPGVMHTSGYSNEKSYDNMPAEVFMFSSDSLDIITGYSSNFEVGHEEKADLKVDLYEATRIVNEKYSSNLNLNVRRIEFVYNKQQENENDDKLVYTCRPVWKLSAVATNSGSDLCIYVDAQSGECYHYENKY